jgi:HKD family nuclease
MFNVIDNRGPNNMRDALNERLKRVSSVDVAVAFVTAAGVDKLLISLRAASKRGHVRVLTGLYEWFTEPAALRRLLSATSATFEASISRRRKFHPKLWILHGRKTVCVVGSSNLTVEGLTSEGEANLVVSTEGKIVQNYFESEWAESVRLTDEIIRDYDAARKLIARPRMPTVPLSAILKKSMSSRESETVTQNQRRFWADALTGFVSKKTTAIVNEATSWDRRGLAWYSAGRHTMKRGDRLCLYDYSGTAYVWLVEIADKTEIRTGDGRYFIAYRKLKGTARRTITAERRSILRSLDVYVPRRDPSRIRISSEKWGELRRFLGARYRQSAMHRCNRRRRANRPRAGIKAAAKSVAKRAMKK